MPLQRTNRGPIDPDAFNEQLAWRKLQITFVGEEPIDHEISRGGPHFTRFLIDARVLAQLSASIEMNKANLRGHSAPELREPKNNFTPQADHNLWSMSKEPAGKIGFMPFF